MLCRLIRWFMHLHSTYEPHFGQIRSGMFNFYPGLPRVTRMTDAPTWNRSYSGGMRNRRITTVGEQNHYWLWQEFRIILKLFYLSREQEAIVAVTRTLTQKECCQDVEAVRDKGQQPESHTKLWNIMMRLTHWASVRNSLRTFKEALMLSNSSRRMSRLK